MPDGSHADTNEGRLRRLQKSILPSFRRLGISNNGQSSKQLSNTISETGILYVLGYFITYFSIVLEIFVTHPTITHLYVTALTFPIQGLWVWGIYTRDRIKAILRSQRRSTWRGAFVEAVSGN